MELNALFNPQSIAIVGATQDTRRAGGQPLYSLTHLGYAGTVYAVNPRYTEIEGRPCYASVDALPQRCDLAVIAVPAADVANTVEACGRKGIRYAVILSAGFREIGKRGAALETGLLAALKRSGVRAVGPNCIGLMNLRSRVFAGFGAAFRKTDWRGGPVAMISQSGGFAYSIMTFCDDAGIGFDHMVSTGNESSLTTLDFIEHFLDDDRTHLIAVYMEGIADGRRLRALGRRALEMGRPIAVWKVGNTPMGKRAAVSHTANLTENYDYYRDAFREGGFVEIREVYDLIDAARVFRARKRPRGNRVAIVTTSGGAGVLISDACEDANLVLPQMTAPTLAALQPVLPDFASTANPIDVTAAIAQKEPEFSAATQAVLDDPNVDMLILRSYPGRDALQWAQNFAAVATASAKPILISLSGTVRESSVWLPVADAAGVPWFEAPGRLVYAASVLNEFARKCERLGVRSDAVRSAARRALPPAATDGPDELHGKACLEAYGIATPKRMFIAAGEAVALTTCDLKFPVALKVVSPDLPHKTEAGGVQTGIADINALRHARAAMQRSISAYKPDARIRGWLIEEMAQGVELIIGALNNPSFGPLVMVGMGGVYAELFRDVVRHYAPFAVDTARELLLSLRGAPILQGYRGNPPCDIDALAEAVSRVSWLIADHADQLSEVEINPVIAGREGTGAIAVDAVIRFL
jgi:acetate---CoA ligase (ADP-forming)